MPSYMKESAPAMNYPPRRIYLPIDVTQVLRCADRRTAARILERAEADTRIATVAYQTLRHPEFRLWYIPTSYEPFLTMCVLDHLQLSEANANQESDTNAPDPLDEDELDQTRIEDSTAYIRYEYPDALGYLAMVGPVLCAMEIGCTVEGWGQGHGIGTQIIRHMQRRVAKQGLFALQGSNGHRLLNNCGFTKLLLPEEVKNRVYDVHPYMVWKMSPWRIPQVMERYAITWDQQ